MLDDTTQELAKLHRDSRLFSSATFQVSDRENILCRLKEFEEYDYLSQFYSEYQEHFVDSSNEAVNRREARSRDLPFIGNNVLKSGRAKFFFVFEGSLQAINKLSITVLSHLWLSIDPDTIKAFCGSDGWWTERNYYNVKDRLRMSSKIAADSYVIDGTRFANDEESTKLVYKEMELLKPKLVVCIGGRARNIVEMRYLDQDTKFHHVKFPKYHSDNSIYDQLSKILDKV